ncbi:MAG TPA: 2-polyprenyl-6-methoxyphenol hydroxylase, partial [Xanthobacteraceae bacterium]|nr:2-polyprenyl-6-methoxyphenol hydroxylase [Xanthobacteraceae bacterium]
WPGARLPHVWLEDGRAVQDIIGYDHGFTLLRLGGSDVSADGLATAFGEIGAPFRVLDLPGDRAREVYGCDLLLLRPDMHIVWRGNRLTEQQDGLARMAAGYVPDRRARAA